MTVYGKIIVIKRNKSDGSAFPLTSNTCLIGRDSHCDIRIQLDTVSLEHSRLDVQTDGQILLTNLSSLNPTTLNHHPVKNAVHVCHMDIISVSDRSLRWEFPANSQYFNSPKPASPVKNASPIAGNWALNSPAKLSPEGKSPPFGDHRSFKVTLGTPRLSPGKKSLQKPLSGKKVPFFLSPKPGKHSPKKILSLKGRGYSSPERVADASTIDQDSKSSPAKAKSVIVSSKKSSPKTPCPSIVLKKISPRTGKNASPRTPSPKSPAKKTQDQDSHKSTSPAAKTPSPIATPKPKVDAKTKSVSKAQRKTSPVMGLLKRRSKTASPTQIKKTAEKTPSPKSTSPRLSPKLASKTTPSPKLASKTTPSPRLSPKLASKKTPSPKLSPKLASKKTPSPKLSPKLASKTTPSPRLSPKLASKKTPSPRLSPKLASKKTPSPKLSPKLASKTTPSPKTPSERRSTLLKTTPRSAVRSGRSSTSPRSPKKTKISLKVSPLRRESDLGFAYGARRSLLRRSGPAPRSRKVSFGPNLSPEQFDRALPPTTPLRKGGRPPRGTPALPMTPKVSPRNAKRSISPAAVSPIAKKMHSEKGSTAFPNKSPAKKTASPVVSSPKKSPEPPKSARRKSSPKIQSTTSPKAKPGTPLMEENVVKIFSPASPDSKKSAALRTIHAKLVLSKAVKKSISPRMSVSSPASAKRKLHSKSQKAFDSGLSDSVPRISKRASLEAMSSDKSFDMNALQTPNGPNEMLVSPMTAQRGVLPSFSLKRMINASPSPQLKPARVSPRLSGSPPETVPLKKQKSKFLVKSPLSDYTNVEGVKRLMKSPRKSPKSDYTNVEGVERLFRRPQKSPKSDYTDVKGVKRLMRSPKSVEDHEEKNNPSPVQVRTYPERSNKLEPVNYLGYEKRTSPGNSESTPIALRKSITPKISSSTKMSPVLKRLSSPLSSRGIRLSIEKLGGKRSRTSFSPELKMVLTPITKLSSPKKTLTPSPPKKLRTSRSSNSPLPVESVPRKSTTPLSKPSPAKISPKVTPVMRAMSPETKTSTKQRITRSARAKKMTRNSPVSDFTKMLTMSALQKSPEKSRRGRPKKTVDTASPCNNKENDEPLVSSPKEKPVRRTRKALKSALKSPDKSEYSLRAATSSLATPMADQSNSRSPVKASPPVTAKVTRGRSKKLMDGESVSSKRKAKPLVVSPKELSPPKRSKSSPAKSPSPVMARRTRTKAVKVQVSPDVVTSSVRQSRKKASKPVVEDTPLAAPKARSSKRKAALEEQPAPNSPKIDTPPAEVPRRTRRGAAKKASPVKIKSPLATPEAPQKKVTFQTLSPAKSVTATRSSRRTRK